MSKFYIKLLTPTAVMPERGSAGAAGLDLRADLYDAHGAPRLDPKGDGVMAHVTPDGAPAWRLEPRGRVVVPTGLAMSIVGDLYARIAPRSGLAVSAGIDTLAGVVDSDYSGEVGAVLVNTDPRRPFYIHHGARIAQLVLERIAMIDPVQVETLPETLRGTGGFGSTGTA